VSGVSGSDRISRKDFRKVLNRYKRVISKFPGFKSVEPSGSFNSDKSKNDFGDMDLILHIESNKDKKELKQDLVKFFGDMPDKIIVPFTSKKYKGRKSYNSGEIVTISYLQNVNNKTVQIDNIIALDKSEASFKKDFLDMTAQKQGLILGLMKVALVETPYTMLLTRLGISYTKLTEDQEYEFNLSSKEIQLRKVTYEPGTFKQKGRDVIWNSTEWCKVSDILYQFNLNLGFEDLAYEIKKKLKVIRSKNRVAGIFNSMVSIKSGEVGTLKGEAKQEAISKVDQLFGEAKKYEVRLYQPVSKESNTVVALDLNKYEYTKVYNSLKRVVIGRGIKDAFAELYLDNKYKKSSLIDIAGKTVGTIIRKNYNGDDINNLVEYFNRPYEFESNKDYPIYKLMGPVYKVLPKEFFSDLYSMTTVGPTSNATGRGELLTWALFNNIDFNDKAGDLVKNNNISIEVKGKAAMIGTNAVDKGFRSATNAKHDLINIGNDYNINADIIKDLNITSSLGVKSAPAYFSFIQAIKNLSDDMVQTAIIEVAVAFLNNKKIKNYTTSFASALMSINNVNDMMYIILSYHFKVYQDYYKFNQFLIFQESGREPTGFTILDPSLTDSVKEFANLIQTTNVKVGSWGGGRPGGMAIK
tara:strand:- start:10657 stop:12576 length:1920 start_codon:yes stop_codon:yes gene_type:complete